MLAQKITFDLMQNKLDDIRVVQGDSCREILFEGSDLDGVLSYDDYTYEFDLMKSDGTFVIQTLSAGVLIPTEQMEVITGTHYYSVKIKDADNELVYSGQGAFIVDDNVITEDAIESVAEVNGLIFPDDFLTVNDHVAFIDDDTTSEDSTWSSQKIQEEIDNNTPVISKTVTGNPVTFTDGASAPIVKCDVTITPIQDLHGYTKPWVGGAGKNLTEDKISGKNLSSAGVIVSDSGYDVQIAKVSQGITYTFTTNDSAKVYALYSSKPTSGSQAYDSARHIGNNTFISPIDGYVAFRTLADYAYAQCEVGNVATPYEPYANICPITGYTDVDVNVAPTTTDTPQTYTVNFGGTYYAGHVDAVKGVFVVTSQMEVFDNTATVSFGRASYDNWYYTIASTEILSESKIPLSNKYEGAYVLNDNNDLGIYKIGSTGQVRVRVGGTKPADTTAFVADLGVNPLQVLYDLPTPLEITLTPAVISSLLGDNAMWTDGDSLEVEYITAPYQPLIDSIVQLI